MIGSLGEVIIDGVAVAPEQAAVSVFDIGLQRGYGCFEALRAYGGVPFRLDAHLDRLEVSAARLRLPLPNRSAVAAWATDRAAYGGDCTVRVIVTGGVDLTTPGVSSRVIVFAEPLPTVFGSYRILPVAAPWHTDGRQWELTGAKTLSYAPNVAASLAARAEGYDDALLLGADEAVLEGPTYSIGWVRDGRFETPSLDVGILESITRAAVIEAAQSRGLQVVERLFRLGALLEADEVLCMSTGKEVRPVVQVGTTGYSPGPITAELAEAFRALVAAETAQ